MLSPPTCVGLRYGRPIDSTRGFSWKYGIVQFGFRLNLPPLIASRRYVLAFVPSGPTSTAYWLEPESTTWMDISFSVPAGFNIDMPVQEC